MTQTSGTIFSAIKDQFHIGTKQFEAINWLPTKERFEQSSCIAFINFFAGAAPAYVSEMFLLIQHSHITRRSQNKFWM